MPTSSSDERQSVYLNLANLHKPTDKLRDAYLKYLASGTQTEYQEGESKLKYYQDLIPWYETEGTCLSDLTENPCFSSDPLFVTHLPLARDWVKAGLSLLQKYEGRGFPGKFKRIFNPSHRNYIYLKRDIVQSCTWAYDEWHNTVAPISRVRRDHPAFAPPPYREQLPGYGLLPEYDDDAQ